MTRQPRRSGARRWSFAAVAATLTVSAACAPAPRGELGAADGALAPRLIERPQGGPLLTWLEPAPSGHRLRISALETGGWSPPTTIFESDRFVANWADIPGAAVTGDGEVFAYWLERLGEPTYAYGIRLARPQTDTEWRLSTLLHSDTSLTEHGFVSSVPVDGGARLFWLDGGRMPSGGAMRLLTRSLRSDGTVGAEESLDSRVCECCSTDAALTSNGPVVVYRDRLEGEIRDISIVRSTTEGWSAPAPVAEEGWHVEGCPVNGPAIDARGLQVAVAWFTAEGDRPRVRLALSADGGASFGEPVTLDAETPLGRVDVAIDANGRVWSTWMAAGGMIRLRNDDRETIVIGNVDPGRASGRAQLARDGDGLVVVWKDGPRLRSRRLPAG